MNYRSVADMNAAIIGGLHRLPRDFELVVGIPRSGLLAANLFSLAANIPMTDVDGFIAGRILASGSTKQTSAIPRSVSEMRKVLVIDDSINSGAAMRDARTKVMARGTSAELVFAAVYSAGDHREADHVFEVVPQPRMFQWNFMHHTFLGQSCVDIDGVLCADPTNAENDDGPAYEEFLREARPLHKPSRKIAYLVTSRLEKYRPQTEAWLARHGIQYGKLVMLDLPSQNERQRRMVHGSFKADFYRRSNAVLFIESEYDQATMIAKVAGKPVLCTQTQEVVSPTSVPARLKRDGLNRLLTNWMKLKTANALPSSEDADMRTDGSVLDIGYVLLNSNDQSKPRTLISYLGPAADNVAEVIESVRHACLLKSEFPIVVLTEFRQDLMVSCETPIEFLPEMRHVPALKPDEYVRYVNRRWELILEKWKVEREVTLASSLDDFLATQVLECASGVSNLREGSI